MKIMFRSLAVAVACVLAFGLAGCSGERGAASSTPSGDATSAAPEKDQKGDVAAFEGDWKVVPKEPHGYTVLTFDAEGNVSAEETAMNPAWKGTIKPMGDGRFAVELTSEAEDNPRWFFTLAPEDSKSEEWIVHDEGGSEFGTFVRAD